MGVHALFLFRLCGGVLAVSLSGRGVRSWEVKCSCKQVWVHTTCACERIICATRTNGCIHAFPSRPVRLMIAAMQVFVCPVYSCQYFKKSTPTVLRRIDDIQPWPCMVLKSVTPSNLPLSLKHHNLLAEPLMPRRAAYPHPS